MNNINDNDTRSTRELIYNYYAKKPTPQDRIAKLQHEIKLTTCLARICDLSPREAHDRFVMKEIKEIMKQGDYTDIKNLHNLYKANLSMLQDNFQRKAQRALDSSSKINSALSTVYAEYIKTTLNKCDLTPMGLEEFQEMAEDLEVESITSPKSPSSPSSSSDGSLSPKSPPSASSSSSSSGELMSPTSPPSASSSSSGELMSPKSPQSASSTSDASNSARKSKATKPKVLKPRPPFKFPERICRAAAGIKK